MQLEMQRLHRLCDLEIWLQLVHSLSMVVTTVQMTSGSYKLLVKLSSQL